MESCSKRRILFGAAAYVSSTRPVFMTSAVAALKNFKGGPKVVVGPSTSDAQKLAQILSNLKAILQEAYDLHGILSEVTIEINGKFYTATCFVTTVTTAGD